MKKKIALMVAFGCLGASAASINYDLLGRKGSKMNSPMVYRNVDYSKAKNEVPPKIGAVLAKKSLNNQGLAEGISAIEGSYEAISFDSHPIYFKRYYSTNKVDECLSETGAGNQSNHCKYQDISDNYLYLNRLNNVFIPTARNNVNPARLDSAGWTNLNTNDYAFSSSSVTYNKPVRSSPYEYNHSIRYDLFNDVKYIDSEKNLIDWWFDGIDKPGSSYYLPNEATDVGVYLGVEALPVKLNPQKKVAFIRSDANEKFNSAYIGYELLAAKTYSVVKESSKRSVVYVSRSLPENPADRTPQIYIGVHNRKGVDNNSSATMAYSASAEKLDNYIYQNRTVEVVASGNFGTKNNVNNPVGSGSFAAEAHAANAITVGAVDANSKKITNYTSYKKPSNQIEKPEVLNFSHFYMNGDRIRTYTKKATGETYVYEPLYDGAEMAAAYTAGMISDLLAIRPFYRWHPEIVKALAITSSHVALKKPYPHDIQVKDALSYYGIVFSPTQSDSREFYHYSRYWIGNMDRLKTFTYDNKKEIWFSYENPHYQSGSNVKKNFTAAIAWLSSGNDIARIGHIPQDFDLWAYESRSASFNPTSFNLSSKTGALEASRSSYNSFEKISFETNSPYIVFRIILHSEDSRTENPNQAVLGFDVASFE